MTDPIAAAGPRLKAERERRGLGAQKAADELHLDLWVIDALEAENYERVGPPVYAKGHLKRYAALLGLPAAEIIAAYESRVLAPKPPTAQTANVRLRADAPAVSNLPWPQIAGSVAVVLLIVGVLWWKPWHQRVAAPVSGASATEAPSPASPDGGADSPAGTAAADSAAPPPMQSATTPQPLTRPPGTGAAAAPAAVPAQGTPSLEADALAGTGHARLRLSFSADSWVDVHDAAGRRAFAGNGRANSVKVIAGVAPMRVYLGFANGVQLEINNRVVAIGPQFLSGDVARFEAGADGVLRRDTHATASPAAMAPGAQAPVAQSRNARPAG